MSACTCGHELVADPGVCPRCGRETSDLLARADAGAVPRRPPARPARLLARRSPLLAALVALLVALAAGASFVGVSRLAAADGDTRAPFQPPPLGASPLPPTPRPLARIAATALTRVVTVEALDVDGHERFGTAWLLDQRGDFVTNAHVISGQKALRLLDRSGRLHVGQLVGSDANADVAVVRSQDGFRADPLPVGDSSGLTLPQPVAVLASARATGHGDVTTDTLVARHRSVTIQPEDEGLGAGSTLIQDDDMLLLTGSLVYQGNSGGPVLDPQGRVIGIVTAASRSSPNAYAIPLERVLTELRSLATGAS